MGEAYAPLSSHEARALQRSALGDEDAGNGQDCIHAHAALVAVRRRHDRVLPRVRGQRAVRGCLPVSMSTFITKLDAPGGGPRVAVKDIVDVEGVPTTCGSRAVERIAQPAARDAACLAGARAAGARLVGKANLHELAMLPIGTNPWFGTPVNPIDPALIPGGSSSGSAVAVATDDADVALGSDTGGSVRVPSACCGTAGLKTTHGRVSRDGVWPLAPSLDTIGPMARAVAGVTLGMA